MRQFVHLHVHSEYSLLDGACRIERLCRTAAGFGSPALALTDHGVMYGAMEFYYAARKANLTPIIGCEAYIAPRGHLDRTLRDEAHVTLLAADLKGYRNLSTLVSKGFLEGYYYKPRIDLDLLARYNDGLILLSGCISGLVAAPLLKNDRESAVRSAKAYRDIFGDRFYIEVMRHGMPEQDIVNDGLISIARELDVPIVATNDAHYHERGDATAHDVLLCIGTGKAVADSNRLKFATDQFYLKTPDEMYELWSDLPEACENTVKLAARVDLQFPKRTFSMPEYHVPAEAPERTPDAYLRTLCEEGLVARYGEARVREDASLHERLEYELGIIATMGYASYFLIVWDFIKYARDRDIPVGPGRGSAAGSLVAYCLRITDLDPLAFNLFFERFLNPDRISMPDIDTDFCVERRDEVIAYVTDKYGADRVSQIVTFGTLAARAAVRDAGRVLGVPLPDVDRVAKLIPSGPTGLSIEAAVTQIAELKMLYDGNPQLRNLLDTAKTIEGLSRNAGTHAAGVVISDRPLVEYVPLVKFADGRVNTQYDMEWIEKIGLLKMDFLGLRNLTVMHNAVREIQRSTDPAFNLQRIPLDDRKTLEMLGRGETVGVFQLESEGMKRVCMELQPSRFADIVALVALYRPGPMEWIPHYINNKHGRTKPSYLHAKLEPILSETYGIAVYQEQVMLIARDVAGFSMAEADELRKVMGKKLKEQVPIYRERFVNGAVRQGIARKLAEEIFAMIEPFAGYGFPKAHAVAYAMIAYQTAYLKANHPVAYLTALLSSVKDRTEKLAEYIEDARRYGVAVLPPDVNESGVEFTATGGQIRFGLSAIKGVGEEAVRSIIEVREHGGPFEDLFDFARRVNARQVNRRVFEALVKCGATDALAGNRAEKLAAVELALDLATRATRDAELGQVSLFGESSTQAALAPVLPRLNAPSRRELLAWEKEMLGIFVSGHPLADVQERLIRMGATPMKALRSLEDDAAVTIAGAVTTMRRATTRAGGQILIAQIEDTTGSCEVVVFPKLYAQLQQLFEPDRILIVKGRLRIRERPGAAPAAEEAPLELSVGANEVTPFDPVPEPRELVSGWHIDVSARDQIDRLAALIDSWPGEALVMLHAHGKTRRLPRTITGDIRVRPELERIFGGEHVRET